WHAARAVRIGRDPPLSCRQDGTIYLGRSEHPIRNDPVGDVQAPADYLPAHTFDGHRFDHRSYACQLQLIEKLLSSLLLWRRSHRAGTVANSCFSPSDIVGWARIASRRMVYGR